MPIVQPHNAAQSMFALMQDSPFAFYATGSRFFGGANEQSDYDFFTQYNPEVESWLVEHGFSRHLDSYDVAQYNDLNTRAVYRYGLIYPSIDVQLSIDVELKKRAHDLYATVLPFLDKKDFKNHHRTLFWDRIYSYIDYERAKKLKMERKWSDMYREDSVSVRGF